MTPPSDCPRRRGFLRREEVVDAEGEVAAKRRVNVDFKGLPAEEGENALSNDLCLGSAELKEE